jgi:tRNA(fMet)-specific endonuclease VapC
MRYLLDTTIVIPVLASEQNAISLIKGIAPEGYAVSILSYLEAYQGVVEAHNREGAERVFTTFFAEAPILPISPTVARRCAEVRSSLKKQGKSPRRRAFDLVIAATALEHNLVLVTHNTKDFGDIPGLALRNM